MSIELKIKSKHLALEPGIIRAEERKLETQITKLLDSTYWKSLSDPELKREAGMRCNRWSITLGSLARHRKWNVRNEARATYLARAFIKGTPYRVVEQKVHNVDEFTVYILPRIITMVEKYHPERYRVKKGVLKDRVMEWLNAE